MCWVVQQLILSHMESSSITRFQKIIIESVTCDLTLSSVKKSKRDLSGVVNWAYLFIHNSIN
jgi:hypothetical protein